MRECHQSYQDYLSKSALRANIGQKRKKIESSIALIKSERICKDLLDHIFPQRNNVKNIALYSPVNGEVNIKCIDYELRRLNKHIFYPKIVSNTMKFVETKSISDLAPGSFGIEEPMSSKFVDSPSIDIFIVPALAIDSLGHRLGYGKGFYDKELQNIPADRIYSTIFDFQFLNYPFGESHDIKINKVFTERRFLRIN